ncbi:MAG: hypothetical protein IJW99_12015, partial [Clostridia bacterium]|nr:hypothetical protein [Clostridia bacterium]
DIISACPRNIAIFRALILRAAGLLHPLRGSPLPEGAKDATPPKINTPIIPNLNVGEFEMFKLGFVERFENFKLGFIEEIEVKFCRDRRPRRSTPQGFGDHKPSVNGPSRTPVPTIL